MANEKGFSLKDFEKAICIGFIKSKINGATSSAKVNEIHGLIAKQLDFLSDYQDKVYAAGYPTSYNPKGQEKTVVAYPKTKKVDITVEKNDVVTSVNSVKFPCSNYNQNSYNYLDSLIGESKRLKDYDNNRIISHVLVVRSEMPYFKNGGVIKNIETITHETIKDYELLVENPNNPNYQAILDVVCLHVVDIKTINGVIPELDPVFMSAIENLKVERVSIDFVYSLLKISTILPVNYKSSDKIAYNLFDYCKKLNKISNLT